MQNYLVEYKQQDNDNMGFYDDKNYISVNCAGYYREDDIAKLDDMNIERLNGRLDYVFCYVAQGRVNLTINETTYVVEEGFFIIPPNVPHRYNNKGTNGSFEIYWVHFSGYNAENFLKKTGLTGSYIFKSGVVEEIKSSVSTLVRELTFKFGFYEEVTQSLLMYIFSIAARQYHAMEKTFKGKTVDVRMQKTLEHIYLYYARDLSIQELADLCQLSASRFSALFKQTFNLYPLQYIINYRIKRGCDLLRHTEYSITQIAEMVGFEDSLYFSRIFKKYVGISPCQYRSSMNPELFNIKLDIGR